MKTENIALGGSLAIICFAIGAAIAWITHIIWAIATMASEVGATVGQLALAAIGAFMPPVGMVHGVMIWMGMGL